MTAAVDISNVTKQFPRTRALDDVSFEIPEAKVFGLLGPNGAGKTTLFSIIAGFLRPTGGHIKVLGTDVRNISELRGRMSILPQDARFAANIPVIEQIVFFSELNGKNREDAEKEAQRALELVGLGDVAKASARTLSHGMYKRLGIAQAFLGTPEVILLDEPTAGLDPASAAGIRDLIESLRTQATLIISSHDLEEIQRMCDMVAILDRGKLVTCSSVQDLTEAGAVQRMSFARPLTDEELATVNGVDGVSGVTQDGPTSYRIRVEGADRPLEQVTAEIVQKLVTTGAVPRSIEDGVALETKFLEVTTRPIPQRS